MNFKHSEELTFRHRLELTVYLLHGQSLRPLLDKLTSSQLTKAQNFLWDKLVEFHYKTQDQEFDRDTVTNKMMPSAQYQNMQKCDLRLDYCKGAECIWTHPVCAGNKIKMNMEVVAKHICSFFENDVPVTDKQRIDNTAPSDLGKDRILAV